MNHLFSFQTNLNDIFTGDNIKKSENSCDYCIKRKRVCKCDTIKEELGSEHISILNELIDLKKYYDEVCEKIVDKYQDVVHRFEYDKDIVKYIKKHNINDEIECVDWLYFYELLKERKILENIINTKEDKDNMTSFNSFHINEEANFISCINYYLKINKYNNVHHNWMGMSLNPFNEYINNNYNFDIFNRNENIDDINKEKKNDFLNYHSLLKMKNEKEDMYNERTKKKDDILLSLLYKDKKFYPLYYYSYILYENEKWISGINNTGNILHLENIEYVWNKTVREGNKIKLFHLITCDCLKIKDIHNIYMNNNKNNMEINKDKIKIIEESIHIERILCISQLVCSLGMINIGGCFIMKIKLSFDNFLLSIFSILSICFKKVDVYRPSCCYLQNIIFLIGIHFNGITSIFLSCLNNWVQLAQKEIVPFLSGNYKYNVEDDIVKIKEKEQKKIKLNDNILHDNRKEDNMWNYINHSIIPLKWIKSNYLKEYKNCINHFIEYIIYELKKCINVSNMSLIKKNIENTKNTYISQFFEEHKIIDIKKKDKLIYKFMDHIYEDVDLLNETYQEKNKDKINDHKYSTMDNISISSEDINNETFFNNNINNADNKNWLKINNTILYETEEKGIYFRNTYYKNNYCNDNIKKYRKKITALLKKIKFKNFSNMDDNNINLEDDDDINENKKTPTNNHHNNNNNNKNELFQLDEYIIKKRKFSMDKNLILKHHLEFENLLKKQVYFTSKNWFKSYLHNSVDKYNNSFFLKKKNIFKDILKCRYYLYYNNYDIHINSFKQILKQYEPLNISYINYELHANVIDCLFTLTNCAYLNIFQDSSFLEQFIVISNEQNVYNFFSKFQNGHYVYFDEKIKSHILSEHGSKKRDTEHSETFLNLDDMYENKKSYKAISELLISCIKDKNSCSFIYIDMNSIYPNFVDVVEKELKIKNYLVGSLIIAYNFLKKNGNMIIRLSSVLTFFTAGLIYILFCSFDKIEFFIPPSCDDISLDIFLYCHNFNENYIYRHYIQFIWDALICNKHIDEKLFNMDEKNKLEKPINKRRKADLYFSVPMYYLMNKHFVMFLKKFNSFYFKHHINVCLNFMKEPKYFYHNKILIKSLLTHFFKAYVIQAKTFENVYKSIGMSYDNFYEGREDSDDEDEEEDEENQEEDQNKKEEQKVVEEKEKIHETYDEEKSFKTFLDLNRNVSNEKNQFEFYSSDSNYSIMCEYKNVPSEISISESAWDSS
ncbi:hypothetical protein PGSY75_0105600 [Plasmodium gaboni]|uniref:Uncharacterized protein n=1 Tax=Plasmodium gaboni TaxID=647221 RepID=A0A151LWY4_9APIC|nr:hypothetical protein PGSY75_0105600 [Plasmodium gaboni]KYO03701.1 hypothetical protein PGSY75_0105600 [Plasmodium gaboni]